jgi:hypothetical protein
LRHPHFARKPPTHTASPQLQRPIVAKHGARPTTTPSLDASSILARANTRGVPDWLFGNPFCYGNQLLAGRSGRAKVRLGKAFEVHAITAETFDRTEGFSEAFAGKPVERPYQHQVDVAPGRGIQHTLKLLEDRPMPAFVCFAVDEEARFPVFRSCITPLLANSVLDILHVFVFKNAIVNRDSHIYEFAKIAQGGLTPNNDDRVRGATQADFAATMDLNRACASDGSSNGSAIALHFGRQASDMPTFEELACYRASDICPTSGWCGSGAIRLRPFVRDGDKAAKWIVSEWPTSTQSKLACLPKRRFGRAIINAHHELRGHASGRRYRECQATDLLGRERV